MLVVHEVVPARNAAELVVLARAQLGKLTFGSAGGGSPSRIAALSQGGFEVVRKRNGV